jgi:hypothetical protein
VSHVSWCCRRQSTSGYVSFAFYDPDQKASHKVCCAAKPPLLPGILTCIKDDDRLNSIFISFYQDCFPIRGDSDFEIDIDITYCFDRRDDVGNLIVVVNGDTLAANPYESIQTSISIYRGPVDYIYDPIRLRVQSQCEYGELNEASGTNDEVLLYTHIINGEYKRSGSLKNALNSRWKEHCAPASLC